MVQAMNHRGPDDRGTYRDDRVALGMTRLAIIDLTAAAHQPMSNPQGSIWIIYNGEVYNFHGERKLLEDKGYSFSSTSDTEVVLRMYEEYGDDFLLRLRGMFALAIYDKRKGDEKRRLLLARDHLGIKPLLYADVGGKLIFASELKALLSSGLIAADVDPVALRLLLTFGSVYQPRTMIRGVKMLPPAHRLVVENGGHRLERYWFLGVNRRPELRTLPYGEAVAELRRVLEDSVREHLVSDVPVGAFLSGGVDSSLLVAMMARWAGRRVKTFSVGFEAEGSAIDESGDAHRTAEFLGTDHTHVLVRGADVRDRIHLISGALDQPSVDGVNSYFVSLAARKAVTVAISGTGGDELFAGYPWFINMVLREQRERAEPYRSSFRSVLGAVACLPMFDRLILCKRLGPLLLVARNGSGFLSRYAANYQIFGPEGSSRLLAPDLRWSAQAGRAPNYDLAHMDELAQGSAIERVTALCLRGYTGNQLLRDIDAVSMAHSLEIRVPYLDRVVTDTALSLPDNAKLGNVSSLCAPERATYRETGSKRILIDVGKPLLRKDFDLQPKRGFAMPFDAWLKGPLREVFLDTVSESSLQRRGLLAVEEASAVRNRFLDGELAWAQPWLLMMLELWCREVLDHSLRVG